MYDVAIFTAGKAGKRIYEMCRLAQNVQIKCFVDNNANLYGETIGSLKIVSPFCLKKMMDLKELDFVLVPSDRMISFGLRDFIQQLEKLEIEKYKIVPSCMIRKRQIENRDIEQFKEILYNPKYKMINQLQHLQFHVTDNCNLNCKRCQHFSNMAKPESYADFDQVKRDFGRLRELFDDIGRIAILGGEPLLNPELSKYCYMVKENFENSRIEIITNGLLVRQMNDEVLKAVKDNGIIINVSYYPVLEHIIEDLVIFLKENNLCYCIGSHIDVFSKRLLLHENREESMEDLEKKYKVCRDACCTTLRDGKIYPCYLPATVHIFNDNFHERIGERGDEDNGIDIYEKNITGIEIIERLKHPFGICRHCGKEETYDWEQTEYADRSDWII